ncbi:MAG: lysylphosphatidylglycerol synthase transmembrane domain-containing protein [Phycisphaerae bacterium]|nr:lysylphosphatidylglycerol synthase transmembrane domain-containing protein [Phycisphaerae bacterium]
MNPSVKKSLWLVVRLAATIGVVLWIIHTTQWRDHATLAKGSAGGKDVKLPVLGQQGDAITLDGAGPEDSLKAMFRAISRRDPQAQTHPLADIARDDKGELLIEWGLAHSFRTVRWWPVAVAILAFAVAVFFQALRWRELLHVQNCRLSVATAAKLMWIGLLFNMFLIGAVGGDLVKAYYVSKHTTSRAESVITVLVDRIIGLLGLLWLSMAGILIWLATGAKAIPGGLPWAWMIPGVVVLLGGVVFYSRPLRRVFGLDRLISRSPEGSILRRLDAAVFLYRDHKSIIAGAFGLTFLSHVCLLGCVLFASLAIPEITFPGVGGRVMHVLVFAPIIFVGAGIIPSVGGLGVQEYGFIMFFSRLGYGSRAASLFLAVLVRMSQILVSLPGALLLVVGAHLPSRAEMLREMESGK